MQDLALPLPDAPQRRSAVLVLVGGSPKIDLLRQAPSRIKPTQRSVWSEGERRGTNTLADEWRPGVYSIPPSTPAAASQPLQRRQVDRRRFCLIHPHRSTNESPSRAPPASYRSPGDAAFVQACSSVDELQGGAGLSRVLLNTAFALLFPHCHVGHWADRRRPCGFPIHCRGEDSRSEPTPATPEALTERHSDGGSCTLWLACPENNEA